MRYLSAALYCEGPTDARFLGPLLERLCIEITMQADGPVEVAPVLDLQDRPADRARIRAERIERAARDSLSAWTVLFVHADADDRDTRTAFDQRVKPAIDRLGDVVGRDRCIVAVVPVRSTDAWLLADLAALRSALGSNLDAQALERDVAMRHGIERIGDPKALVDRIFEGPFRRGRRTPRATLVTELGQTASLDALRRLDAFARLESDLKRALRERGLLRA